MTVNRKGFGAAVSTAFKSKWRGGVEEALLSGQNEIFVGRVTDIILNDQHPKFQNYGEWNGIGTIFFEAQGNEFVGSNNIVAKPLSPQRSSFPLVNEMVLIFTLPNKEMGQSSTSTSYFYINVISIWNSPHHNAYPNPITTSDLPPSQQKDYQQTSAGSVRRVTDGSTEIDLNSSENPSQDTFREQSNIHPLLPFAGDIMYEGRFGNSIRFGSTANASINFPLNRSSFIGPLAPFADNSAADPYFGQYYEKEGFTPPYNNWSNSGQNGDPLIIIRNGQNPESSDEGWVPVVEDINKDLSSIYITSNQLIPISVKNYNYESYDIPPTDPTQFKEPQVIINSNRLVFNAKTDSILLSAQESIFLGGNSSVNIKAPKMVFDSPSIKLGDKNAKESIILGDIFLRELSTIMSLLSTLCSALSNTQLWPTGVPQSAGSITMVASTLKQAIKGDGKGFLDRLENYKSGVSKTR